MARGFVGYFSVFVTAPAMLIIVLNVVVLTSSAADKDRERAHALGAGAYVVKDPDFHAFRATLDSLVNEVRDHIAVG